MVKIITSTILANYPNLPDSQRPTQNLPENMPRSTRPTTIPTRATHQDEPLYAPCNVLPTPKTFFRPNAPYPTTPGNVFPTSETASLHNIPYPTTPIVTPIRGAH